MPPGETSLSTTTVCQAKDTALASLKIVQNEKMNNRNTIHGPPTGAGYRLCRHARDGTGKMPRDETCPLLHERTGQLPRDTIFMPGPGLPAGMQYPPRPPGFKWQSLVNPGFRRRGLFPGTCFLGRGWERCARERGREGARERGSDWETGRGVRSDWETGRCGNETI